MRKIKLPRDLYKYKDQILRDLENQYNEFSSLNDMSYYESYKLNEIEIELFKLKYIDNVQLTKTIEYYQEDKKDAFDVDRKIKRGKIYENKKQFKKEL